MEVTNEIAIYSNQKIEKFSEQQNRLIYSGKVLLKSKAYKSVNLELKAFQSSIFIELTGDGIIDGILSFSILDELESRFVLRCRILELNFS